MTRWILEDFLKLCIGAQPGGVGVTFVRAPEPAGI